MIPWLIPYRRLVLETDLPHAEVIDRLRARVADADSPPDHDHAWYGWLGADRFRFRRGIASRHGGLPVVEGRVGEVEGGTRVVVHVRLTYPVLATLAALALFVGWLVYSALVIESSLPVGMIAMTIVLYVIINLVFGREARKVTAMLRETIPEPHRQLP